MKKLATLTLILLLLCAVLCGCKGVGLYAPRQLENKQPNNYQVYVCGGVQFEGYVTVMEGETYADAIFRAGFIKQTILPNYSQKIITQNTVIIVEYFENGRICSPLNVNSPAFALTQDVSQTVKDKIANYIGENGKITNKNQLKQILTEEEYSSNYYKLFVAKGDYEKVS